jgi:hypothetical protein
MRWRGACCHYAAAAAAAAAATIRCCCLCSRCWRQTVLDFVLLSVAASVRSPFALNQKSSKNATPFVLAAVSAPAESPTPNKYRIRAEIIAGTVRSHIMSASESGRQSGPSAHSQCSVGAS